VKVSSPTTYPSSKPNSPISTFAIVISRYNMMANVAKNLYALRAYKPAAQVIYEKGS
jgi:hypothetical protein